MPTITIRHVPDEVRNELAARAARRGQSLQEFMLSEIERLAAKPAVEEWLADVRRQKAGARPIGRDSILSDVAAERR